MVADARPDTPSVLGRDEIYAVISVAIIPRIYTYTRVSCTITEENEVLDSQGKQHPFLVQKSIFTGRSRRSTSSSINIDTKTSFFQTCPCYFHSDSWFLGSASAAEGFWSGSCWRRTCITSLISCKILANSSGNSGPFALYSKYGAYRAV